MPPQIRRMRALTANPALIGGAGRHADCGGDAGGGLVLPAGAGYPALSALPRAALRLLSGGPARRCWSRSRPPGTRRGRCCWPASSLLALAALANAWLGAYHAGVEWGFWQGPTDCTGPVGNLGSAGSLLERLDTVKVIRCDEVQWRFLGLSLAGYNVLISLLMAAIAAWGLCRRDAIGHRCLMGKPERQRVSLIVDIFLRPSEQMDDAGRRDR